MIKYYFYGMLDGFKEIQKNYIFENLASVKSFQKHTIYIIEDAVLKEENNEKWRVKRK